VLPFNPKYPRVGVGFWLVVFYAGKRVHCWSRTLTEAVLEAAGERLEVPHAPGTRGPAADSLGGPVVCKERETANASAQASSETSRSETRLKRFRRESFPRLLTVALAGGGVAARAARGLLDVVRAAPTPGWLGGE
jgi:hypothetical protein